MKCPDCGVEISDEGRPNGGAVPPACPRCSGKPIRGEALGGTTLLQAPPELQPTELRQMTVLICDLVGSTDLAHRLDVEDYVDVIGAYCRRVRDVVTRYGGFVAKYMGDGALVYFGYPEPHEDDAERATLAALALVAEMSTFDRRAESALQVRIGIASGLVVVGATVDGATEPVAVGPPLNLAARLQALAGPNSVVVSASTRKLIGVTFDCRDLGTSILKGFAAPEQAWQVLRAAGVESRFEARRATDTALVGRGEEVSLLVRRWQQAKRGEGQLVLLSGEPGIGKSRVVRAIEDRIGGEPHARMHVFCTAHQQDTPLHPFISQLEHAAGIEPSDAAQQKRKKLELLLATTSSGDIARDVALLAWLLSIDAGEPLPKDLNPQKRKEAVLDVLLAKLVGLAARQPALIVFEDVHWIDPTSLELLEKIVDRVNSLPILLIATFRPEFQPQWLGLPHVTMLAFRRLNRGDSMAMIAHACDGRRLPAEIAEQIADRTDGVPLFIEEFTRAAVESGLPQQGARRSESDRPLERATIPTTLRGSLLARIGHASVRDVAQAGAAIGREFSYELLASLFSPGDDLRKALDQLVAVGLLRCRGTPPNATYSFRHFLLMEAAYDTLLRGKRRALHARIASLLEKRSAEFVETQPELLARHWAEAGFPDRAIALWQKAAQRAMARSAPAEAVAHLQKSLALVPEISDLGERDRHELDLQIALGGGLMAAKGYAVPETDAAFSRARQLCERTGDARRLLPITWGQFSSRFVGGKQKSAFAVAKDLVDLASRTSDAGGRRMGHACLGTTLLHMGELLPARAQFEQALAIEGVAEREVAFLYGQSARVTALAYMSLDLLLLGFPDEAQKRSEQSLQEAEVLSHPPSVCFAYSVATRVQFIRHDKDGTAALAATVIKRANAQGLRLWQALGNIYSGWTEAAQGHLADGIASMRKGVAQYRQTGSRLSVSFYLATLGSAYALAGEHTEALKTLSEALEASEAQEEWWIAADIHRRLAKVLLALPQPDVAEAEAELRTAIALAHQQGAKLWQLRSVTALARLFRDQGKQTEARHVLHQFDDRYRRGSDGSDAYPGAGGRGDAQAPASPAEFLS